jgi:hypothetical protein
MEVRKGLVYPHQTLLDDVQINASAYVVVNVDMVYENAKKHEAASATRQYDADSVGCNY